jgi:hypothetical protein
MKNYLFVLFIIFSTVTFCQDQPAEVPAKTVEDAPAAAPEVNTAEPEKKKNEVKVKPANVKVQPVKETASQNANAGGELVLLDINDARLTKKRIPDISLPENKVEQTAAVKQPEADKKEKNASNNNFEHKLSLALKIGLAMLVLVIIAFLKMKDKKKRRKVFKVSKR